MIRSSEVTKVRVLSNRQDLLDLAPEHPMYERLHLPSLSIGALQNNMLGEGRAFFLDYSSSEGMEYVGFVNARWNEKYFRLRTKLQDLPDVVDRFAAPGIVLAPWPTNCSWLDYGTDWYRLSVEQHCTMEGLLQELAELTGLSVAPRNLTFWANDFICHWSVFEDWLQFWRSTFSYFMKKYGFELPFSISNTDPSRYCAYFYERFSTIYFANRDDLRVLGVP